MWNVFNGPMEIRTNNHVESYHRRWNQAVGVRHPSIWSFIRVLKDQRSVNEVTIQSIRNGNQPPVRRRKWRRLDHRINEKSRVQQRTNQSGSILASNYTFDIEHYIMMLGFYFMFLANNRCYDKRFIKK